MHAALTAQQSGERLLFHDEGAEFLHHPHPAVAGPTLVRRADRKRHLGPSAPDEGLQSSEEASQAHGGANWGKSYNELQ